jgi:hypothetical protein
VPRIGEAVDPAEYRGYRPETKSLQALRWREIDSNYQYVGTVKARELSAQGQPRCVRTREMLGRSRYPDNPWFDEDQRHA